MEAWATAFHPSQVWPAGVTTSPSASIHGASGVCPECAGTQQPYDDSHEGCGRHPSPLTKECSNLDHVKSPLSLRIDVNVKSPLSLCIDVNMGLVGQACGSSTHTPGTPSQPTALDTCDIRIWRAGA